MPATQVQGVFVIESTLTPFGHPLRDFVQLRNQERRGSGKGHGKGSLIWGIESGFRRGHLVNQGGFEASQGGLEAPRFAGDLS